MKIWKAQDGEVSQGAEAVFSSTGNVNFDSGSFNKPFMLDTPAVIYFPGKGTVLPDVHEKRSNQEKEEMLESFNSTVKDAKGLYDVHLSEGENPPEFYIAAYTDNLSDPPSKNEASVTGVLKKYGSYVDAALKNCYGYDDYKGSRLKQVFAHKKRPASFFSHDAKMFVDDMLMPAITDKDNDLLPTEEVKHKLDNLTLIGFSYGSIFCKEVENRLQRQLAKHEMTEQEITDVMQHVVTMSSSSVARVRGSQNLFTGYHFEGRLDVLRRNVQSLTSELIRGVPTFPDSKRRDVAVPEGVRGMSPEVRERHSWKGLEIRDSVYKKRGLIHDAYSSVRAKVDGDYEPVSINNSVIILLDAPETYTSYGNLQDIYQENPESATENKWHHQFGAALLSDPNKQCHVLLFNRVLNNAIERGAHRNGVDMGDSRHLRELITQVPWHDMMPDNMRRQFQNKVQHAFMLGDIAPFTEQYCDVPKGSPVIIGAVNRVTSLFSQK